MIKKPYTPYKFWSRDELYKHLIAQHNDYPKANLKQPIRDAVYDDNWDPKYEYNGCSVVQDPIHPFAPCFLHDYSWVVLQGTPEDYKRYDKEFYERLKIFGMRDWKAKCWYIGVRIGWFFMIGIKRRKKRKQLNLKQ